MLPVCDPQLKDFQKNGAADLGPWVDFFGFFGLFLDIEGNNLLETFISASSTADSSSPLLNHTAGNTWWLKALIKIVTKALIEHHHCLCDRDLVGEQVEGLPQSPHQHQMSVL